MLSSNSTRGNNSGKCSVSLFSGPRTALAHEDRPTPREPPAGRPLGDPSVPWDVARVPWEAGQCSFLHALPICPQGWGPTAADGWTKAQDEQVTAPPVTPHGPSQAPTICTPATSQLRRSAGLRDALPSGPRAAQSVSPGPRGSLTHCPTARPTPTSCHVLSQDGAAAGSGPGARPEHPPRSVRPRRAQGLGPGALPVLRHQGRRPGWPGGPRPEPEVRVGRELRAGAAAWIGTGAEDREQV